MRERVLRTWAESPARFREDANAEEDLRIGGYRDRVLVELAQNAADAAGADGELAISVVDGELRAANTGAALDEAGVAGLASLRASAKRAGDTAGRFGVGFAAVLTVTDEPAVCSSGGGVRFSAARTRAAVAAVAGGAEPGDAAGSPGADSGAGGRGVDEPGADRQGTGAQSPGAQGPGAQSVAEPDAGVRGPGVPGLATELAARAGTVPVLRLPWPAEEPVPDGFATEVRLPLLDGVDPEELLEQARRIAPDLLLAFPALHTITVARRGITAERSDGQVTIGQRRWVVARTTGEVAERSGLGVEETGRYTLTWAVPVDEAGKPAPLDEDVLHTPTPTDERLTLPARLLAGTPMEPDRRRVRAGAATDAVLDAAVAAYPDLLRRFAPADRLALVPRPGFPASEVDARLRDGLLERCRTEPLLPAADGTEIAASSALALEHRSETEALLSLLSSALPGLLAALDDEVALRALDVRRIGLAGIADAVLGLEREPSWWRALYTALAAAVDAGADRDELGALPVPMLDGRTMPGPRGVLLPEPGVAAIAGLDVLELPIAHPDAVHPLLNRLGAVTAGPGELLDAAELRAAVERSLADAEAGLDLTALTGVVLRLVAETGDGRELGALALRDAEGAARRADELLLPDAALRELLDPEAVGPDEPLGVLAADLAERYPRAALRAVGALDGFAVVTDEEPVAPEHGLADEDEWWRTGPSTLHGIRDLDLVADHAWEQALAAIAADPLTWHALTEPGGYTGWWIARYATLAGHAPRHWRMPGAGELAGLYEPLPHSTLDRRTLAAAGVRTGLEVHTAADVAELLGRLADRTREPGVGTVLRVYEELARAVRDGRCEPSDVDAPDAVRALGGRTAAGDALVADLPWLLGTGLAELVPVDTALAEPLGRLLDLPPASEELETAVRSAGEPAEWAGLAAVLAACELLGVRVPEGGPRLHDPLVVSVDGADHEVPWWVDGETVHVADDERGLARALAWCAGMWGDRHRIEALLRDPDPATMLG